MIIRNSTRIVVNEESAIIYSLLNPNR